MVELISRDGSTALPVGAIALLVLGILIITTAAAYSVLSILRRRYDNPRWIPTQYLKNRWRRWSPRSLNGNKYHAQWQDDESVPTLHLDRSTRPSSHLTDLERARHSRTEVLEQGANGVERNTSVRSVMTLPAYSKSARENEQILGREGERGGIDVVLENPETAEEEESQRDEEMESLYQIRRQRRQEIAEREERRQERRDARARGDYERLNTMRLESIQRAQNRETTGSAALIAEYQGRSRERRVSSVSYGDLGVARHDGSRVRAGSANSDRQPLLDSAASISGQSMPPALLRDSLSIHTRGRSTSSIMSGVSSNISDSELDAPPFGRSGSDFEVVAFNQRHSRNLSATSIGHRSRASSAASRPSIDTSRAMSMSPHPPTYDSTGFEEAPPYVSPATERANAAKLPQILTTSATGAPMLPNIGRLPSIRIAEATPVEPTEPFPSFH